MDILEVMANLAFRKSDVGMLSRAFRHAIAGGIGTIVYMANVAILVELVGVNAVVSSAFAFVTLEVYTYAINRLWVYESQRQHGYAIPRFLIVTCAGLFLNTGIMYMVVELFGLWYVWGLVATTLIVPPTNFLLNFYWAFK